MASVLAARDVAALTGLSEKSVYARAEDFGGVRVGKRSWVFPSCRVAGVLKVTEEWLEAAVAGKGV